MGSSPLVTHSGREVIFVIDDRVPHVDVGVGDPRAALIGRSLALLRSEAHIVWCAVSDENAAEYSPALNAMGIEVLAGDVEETLRQRAGEAGAVVVSRPSNFAMFRDAIDRNQPQAVRIYDAESLFYRRSMLEAMVTQQYQTEKRAGAEIAAEAEAVLWADGVLAISEDVVEFAKTIHPEVVTGLCSYAVSAPIEVPTFIERSELVFFGGFRAGPGGPNEDAAIIAAEQIAPLIGKPLIIAGAAPTQRVKDLAIGAESAAVRVVGRVDDSVAYLAGFRVNLCPLRFGSGLKLRLVDAAAAGTPSVMTSCAAENLGLDENLSEILVADSVSEQADKAIALLNDASLWQRASDSLRLLAEERYTNRVFETALNDFLRALGI
ncbi:MAG: glycosyltransferase [Acidimicrobiia bacterium]|nr:glycosyltransferase [Acidimicrobiia bacterium]